MTWAAETRCIQLLSVAYGSSTDLQKTTSRQTQETRHDDRECTICLQDLAGAMDLTTCTQCRKSFHGTCFRRWADRHCLEDDTVKCPAGCGRALTLSYPCPKTASLTSYVAIPAEWMASLTFEQRAGFEYFVDEDVYVRTVVVSRNEFDARVARIIGRRYRQKRLLPFKRLIVGVDAYNRVYGPDVWLFDTYLSELLDVGDECFASLTMATVVIPPVADLVPHLVHHRQPIVDYDVHVLKAMYVLCAHVNLSSYDEFVGYMRHFDGYTSNEMARVYEDAQQTWWTRLTTRCAWPPPPLPP